MTIKSFIVVIEVLIFTGLLVWFFSRPWQNWCTSVTRQNLFALRDQLFDIAADQHIEFSDPVYCRLREYLNGCIRFAHEITFGIFIVGVVCLGSQIPKKSDLQEDIESVTDEKARQEMYDIFRKSVSVLLCHMMIRSPFLSLFLLCIYCFATIRSFVNNKVSDIGQRVRTRFEVLVLNQADSATPSQRSN